ncbi:MAG TPA: radical SAM family heme chaperone HemW [Actinomycetes bacterium]|nr:radical SAM family heme chaperone HemW [Actinomycetes bacterium]
MPSTPPEGQPAPSDGSLPEHSLTGLGDRGFGAYVHVPFCARRCGYCDFNTYTAVELGGGAAQAAYADTVALEVDLARRVLGDEVPALDTVFFGGGTPTRLPPADLARILAGLRERFGMNADAEVTTEANPDSVDAAGLHVLREAGFTRISFGMQSAVPHVLATLDRTHEPARLPAVIDAARAAGFDEVSVDLIYGTPGESVGDWRRSVEAAVAMGPDHVSAYALVVEPGTALAARVRRGEVEPPDDDDLADKYVLADELLTTAGYSWYEVSNWARDAKVCRHNVGYWRGADWWGFGPGAHSHVGGTRWWNVRHPSAWASRLQTGASPTEAREVLSAEERREEQVLLEVRLVDGIAVDGLDPAEVSSLVSDGLVDPVVPGDGRVRLTLRGRLLADHVVRRLLS